jgi:Tfp pilus assembly protein PilO
MEEARGDIVLFNKYKKMILNLAVVLAALLVSFRLYTAQEKEISGLRKQKENEVKKNAVLADIGQMERRLDSYRQFLNKKKIVECVVKLNNAARSASVNISSIMPLDTIEAPYYSLYPFNLVILGKDYHALAKFINDLEKDSDIYMINLLSIGPQGGGDDAKNGASQLRAEMQIATILYKN